MKIRLTVTMKLDGRPYKKGDIYEIADDEAARRFCANGYGTPMAMKAQDKQDTTEQTPAT